MFRVLGIYNFGWSKNYEVSVNLPLRGTMERKSRKKPSTYNKILIKVLLLKIFSEMFRLQNKCKLCKSVTNISSREYKCCKCLIFYTMIKSDDQSRIFNIKPKPNISFKKIRPSAEGISQR